ncbi:hypothetical protein [Vibrio pectenicida]|uniref:Uncharacterized protein n=2 Tax=Vibrio TaxID=662 RepID=A0A3R9EJC9_9VIBR|nr:hypothetical protein [Vibrio pectenicida]RSD31798.1 hypothetical protein EJA03_07170 [Vibrio pectenicida]
MSITTKINNKIKVEDLYLSLKLTNGEQSQIISNMPCAYKDIYYQNQYDKIDDTFDFTEQNPGRVCYPNELGEYTSNYIKKMAGHGYYNLFSFSLSHRNQSISCIVTVPWKPHDNQLHFSELRDKVINSTKTIIREFSQYPELADIDLALST